MDLNWLILLLCSLGGLMMLAGSLYLLWKGRINMNKEGRSPTKIKLPGGFEMETPVAGLVMFVLGVFMLFVPIYYSPKMCRDLTFHDKKPLEMVELRGKVSTDTDVEVYVVVDEQRANAEQTISLSVPLLSDRRYVVRYMDPGGGELAHQNFRLDQNVRLDSDKKVFDLRPVGMRVKAVQEAGPAASPTPQIILEQSEPSSAISEFKYEEGRKR